MAEVRFREHFQKGISPYLNTPRGASFLSSCRGLRPGPSGLEAFTDLPDATGLPSATWPWPICKLTHTGDLYTQTSTLLYKNTTLLCTHNYTTPLTHAHKLHTNSEHTFHEGMCGGRKDYPVINTLCTAHKSRTIEAGFVGQASADWLTSTHTLLDGRVTPAWLDSLFNTLGPKTIAWSSITGGDDLFLHDPAALAEGPAQLNNYVEGANSDTRPWWYELLLRNERGFMDVPGDGEIMHMCGTDQRVLVFTDAGVGALIPFVAGDGSPSYGWQWLIQGPGPGATSRVGVDYEAGGLFLDQQDRLWRVPATGAPVLLGFQTILRTVLTDSSTLRWSYNAITGDWYLSIGTTSPQASFCLTPENALVEMPVHPSGCATLAGSCVGKTTAHSSATFTCSTAPTDLGSPVIKTLSLATLRGRWTAETLKVTAYYRMQTSDPSETWKTGASAVFDDAGNARLAVSGAEFYFTIESVSGRTYADVVQLEELVLQVEQGGKTFLHLTS